MANVSGSADSSSAGASKAWPVFRSLQAYRLSFFTHDLFAGLTLAAIAIPEQMATARLAGFGPQVGFLALIGAGPEPQQIAQRIAHRLEDEGCRVVLRAVKILACELADPCGDSFVKPSLLDPPGIETGRIHACHAARICEQA